MGSSRGLVLVERGGNLYRGPVEDQSRGTARMSPPLTAVGAGLAISIPAFVAFPSSP